MICEAPHAKIELSALMTLTTATALINALSLIHLLEARGVLPAPKLFGLRDWEELAGV